MRRTRAAALAGSMLAHLRLIGVDLRPFDSLLAGRVDLGHGLLLLLFLLLLLELLLLLRPRRRLVCRGARHLKRERHAAIDRERMALGLGLGMQGGRVTRTTREVINDLRLRPRRWRGFYFGWRRGHGGRLFRLRDKSRRPNRRNSDEHGKPTMVTGTSHGVALKQAGRNSDNRNLR